MLALAGAGSEFSAAKPNVRAAVAVPALTDGGERTRKAAAQEEVRRQEVVRDRPEKEEKDDASVASTSSAHLRAAAVLLQKQKELEAKMQEVKEARIDVEMAAERSSQGSRQPAGRSRDIKELDLCILTSSPESLPNKIARMKEYAMQTLPAVPELPGAEGSAGAENVYIQNNFNETHVNVEHNVNIMQEARFAVAATQVNALVHQHGVERMADARISETLQAATAHCATVTQQANVHCAMVNAASATAHTQVEEAVAHIGELYAERCLLYTSPSPRD